MSPTQTMVVVGAGLAGAKAVETLREQGFDGRVVLFGDEPDRPYNRPPLSKEFLNGSKPKDSIYVHDADWYPDHDVELRTGVRVIGLDLDTHEVRSDDGERTRFDKVLLATGSSPRRVNMPGADLAGVHYLRRVGDSEALLAEFSGGGRRVVMAGGGWIGLEVAAAARAYGNDVTIIEGQRTVLHAALGDELGEVFAQLHREHGVRLLLRDRLETIEGSGRVTSVTTTSGKKVPADLVVIGMGARPNVELALQAGLDLDDGVRVDASLRSSHPDVFAAGDIANIYISAAGRRLRVEHWANALNSGPAAAKAMLGERVEYDRVPYFFTDQYDVGMEYSGSVAGDGFDQIVYRGDPISRSFVAFWLDSGRVVAGMNVNVWDVAPAVQDLIRSGAVVDLAALADPAAPLELMAARVV